MMTTIVVLVTSDRDGQVTFLSSDFASLMNAQNRLYQITLSLIDVQSFRVNHSIDLYSSPSLLGYALAGEAGLEPATCGFGDRCSSQLSYSPVPFGISIPSPI